MKNSLLYLRGEFKQEKRKNAYGRPTLKGVLEIEHLDSLLDDLIALQGFWLRNNIIDGALIDVKYNRIVPKSSRISSYFSSKGIDSEDSIRGARFAEDDSHNKKHIFTHYVSKAVLQETINSLHEVINITKQLYDDKVLPKDIIAIQNKLVSINSSKIKDDFFIRMLCDSYLVEGFDIPSFNKDFTNTALISLYDVNVELALLLSKVGIRVMPDRIIKNTTTVLLNKNELDLLKGSAPYLISMGVEDEKTIEDVSLKNTKIEKVLSIPKPSNEPIIGVIDKIFDRDVYFSDWVEDYDLIDKTLREVEKDDYHGTTVSSIIVDGPSFNPGLDDGCGRFRVRHFAVAVGRKFSSFTLLKNIQSIIANNRDIKVWNISLGSILEINPNYVSPEAAILDQIQYENDVIFVVSGTNDSEQSLQKYIGAPADSINSIVVNSVNMSKHPATYTRKGPVLSFFHKPDVSYYGGDEDMYLHVCTPLGERLVSGTSYAAPWIARKLAYLIYVLKFNREVAKALIIDSAAGWNNNAYSEQKGYGVVPIKISDIIESNRDEIKFYFFAKSEKYNTYTYNIPVPLDENDKFPFVAKATLCYFPACSRNQGVDYTNTEFDISFGRMAHNKIKTINNNIQTDTSEGFVFEENAREYYRKWDNVKHIQEEIKPGVRARNSYETSLWGLSVKTKERLKLKYGEGMNFGVVVTLKEITGKNRIEDFVRQCTARGWIVSEIKVSNRIEIYNKAEETIKFDE